MAERLTVNEDVAGSTPAVGAMKAEKEIPDVDAIAAIVSNLTERKKKLLTHRANLHNAASSVGTEFDYHGFYNIYIKPIDDEIKEALAQLF